MAEVTNNSSSDTRVGKNRAAKKNPRIDMTPMVDLAFLLLTFFVLTSNLHKPKVMEMTMHAEGEPSPINVRLANTILIDANGKAFYYSGKFSDETQLKELDLSSISGLREIVGSKNADVQSQMKTLREIYKSGVFVKSDYEKINGFVTRNTKAQVYDAEVVKNNKKQNYSECIAAMDADLSAGVMSDATFKKAAAIIRNADDAPFFIVKWGDDARYGDVIGIIDELKIGDISKYTLTTISPLEKDAVSRKKENAVLAPVK
ncbi:MAG TPA: biopolymer transporter ExbD [Bacteroidia bacterium]|nr:biopolymer transporter ExbD [Bacteroidia bacterium]